MKHKNVCDYDNGTDKHYGDKIIYPGSICTLVLKRIQFYTCKAVLWYSERR